MGHGAPNYSPVGPALLAENQAQEKILSIFVVEKGVDNSFYKPGTKPNKVRFKETPIQTNLNYK